MEIRLLGPIEIWAGTESVPAGPPKQRCVLAVLALEANRVVPVETVIDRVWDHESPAAARGLVQTYVTRLRRVLGRCGTDHAATLTYRSGGYMLTIEPDLVDLHRFRRQFAKSGAALLTDRERAVADMRRALALWRGDPLSGLDGTWARGMRDALEEQRLSALHQLLDVELTTGRHEEVLGQLDELLTRHPLDERLIGQRLIALHRAGRQAEALRGYREARTRLLDEVGDEPGPELRDLHQRLLRRDPALNPPSPHHDRPDPEHPVPAAVDPTAASSMPADATATPAQLPLVVAGFTGRAAELAWLDSLPPDAPATAAVIAGSAGVGKTALAVFWGQRVLTRFPGGQLYVNLRGYAAVPPMRPLEVLAQFLRALGVAGEQIPVEVDEAACLYRTMLAGKRVLVVLDNASSADQIRPLLPASPGCLAVITSRDRLTGLVAHEGARRLDLDVLSPAEARTLLMRILDADSVRAELDSAAELARLCAYLPLALRITAANLANHRHRRIAEHVTALQGRDRLAQLEVEDDEQVAVRRSFDLSYEALKPEARQLFRRLGLIPGPDVTVPAAAALAAISDDRARGLLNHLASAHLVEQPTADRFTLHDLLRLYAKDRAEAEDSRPSWQQAIRRLFDFYLATTHAAVQLLYPRMAQIPGAMPRIEPPVTAFPGSADALAWLDNERPNIVAATRYAADHDVQPVAWLLAETLRGYFWHNRYTIDWFTVAHAGLSAANAFGDKRVQAVAHQGVGQAQHSVAHYPLATEHFTTALALARQTRWPAGQASALNNLGCVSEDLGHLDHAVTQFEESLALSREADSPRSQAAALTNLGEVCWLQGRIPQAAGHFTTALRLNREIGSQAGHATCLRNLGKVLWQFGRFDDALDHLVEALALHREGGSRFGEATTLHDLSAVHHDAGHPHLAFPLALAALGLTRQTGDRRNEGNALNILAAIHCRLGNNRQAIDYHQQALHLDRATGHPFREAQALLGLGAAHCDLGQHAEAHAYAVRALALVQHNGIRVLEGQALTTLATIDLAENRPGDAVRHAERSVALQRETRQRFGQARALHILGSATARTRGVDAAARHWQEALRLYTDIGVPEAAEIPPLLSSPAR